MNNNPIGWPDNGFGYNASTQTLNVPRQVLVNAPRSYTGSLLDLRGYNAGSIFSVFAQSSGLPAVALLPAYAGNVAGGQVTLSAASWETILNLSTGGGGFTLRITNGDANASVNLATAGNLFLGNASPQPALTGADGASILAQRNGTNAQTYRVYNTYTSATNHERGKLEWASNTFRVGTEKGSGGGTARSMALQTDATDRLTIDTIGSVRVATALTVATLPGTPTVGMIARVTDASAPAIGSTVAGGGAAAALCWYNGTNWTVLGI